MIISTRAAATALAISLASSSSNNHHYRMAVAEMVAASSSSSSSLDNNASMEESSEDHPLINNNEEEEAREIINVEEVDVVIPNNEVEIEIATTASLGEEEKHAERSSTIDNRHYDDERSEDEKDVVVVQAMIDGEGDEGNVVFYGNHTTDTDYADADAEDEDEEEDDESDSISTTIITSATERDLTSSEYKTLATTYCCKGNRGASNGMMFNLKPKKRLVLHEMAFHTWMTGAVGIEVWVKKGNYRGYEKKPGAWTKWVNTQVIGRGTGAATRIPPSKFGRMAIEIGEMRGFYIRCAGASSNACLLSSKQGYKAYSNSELTYYGNGSSKRITWNGSTIMPRTFNGQFRYEVASSQGVGGRDEPMEVALLGFDPTPPPTPKPTPRPTFKPVAPTPISGNFRLRLYWEKGYYWQESTKETFWCMETDDSDEGDKVYVDWCKSDKDEQRWVKVDNTFRPDDDTSLCMTTTGTSESNPIRLYKCDGRIEQEFLSPNLVAKDVKFQMKPKKYGGSRCLTQQHHPKADERVYPEECGPAIRDTTGYWITY